MIDVYENTRKDENYKDKMSIKWDADLESYRKRNIPKKFSSTQIIKSIYRPFISKNLYFDKHFNGRTYQWYDIYREEKDNQYLVVPGLGSQKDFHVLGINTIVDLNALPAGGQTLPLYTFDSDGNRLDNITEWGLGQFRERYGDSKISREDIFHYVYGVLHNPEYRKKYELNLKREFPRVPFYEEFWAWAEQGKKLMELHIGYEDVEPWDLERVDLEGVSYPSRASGYGEKGLRQDVGLDSSPGLREPQPPALNDGTRETPTVNSVDSSLKGAHYKVKLKADKEKGIIYIDENTALTGVPPEAWEYKLGNRSALEWVLDQYKEKKPRDKTIREKFNTYRFADYKEEVIVLLGKVCRVSVETVGIVRGMW
ncbi:MAG: hypothetical protein Kapaf2KO_10440 [Candidatus Kapaibacteriales bacterium]